MESRQVAPSETDPNFAGQVLETMESPEKAASDGANMVEGEAQKEDLPKHIKERLGRQEHRHKKELRELQAQLQDLHQRVGSTQQPSANGTPTDPYNTAAMQPGSHEEMIHRAVNAALAHKDNEQKQREEAEKLAHVHGEYQRLQEQLDKASSKYDDFDDVVRDGKKPYTEAMRDAALLLPNADDVLYKLGKNKDELERISRLHPIEQAKEMIRLSVALMGGANNTAGSTMAKPQVEQIKSTPVNPNSRNVNEQTPVSDIRARMKAGSFR